MTAAETTVLRASHLRVSFVRGRQSVEVVRGIDLRLRRGETLAVVGESGSGKSMSALALVGLLPTSARISGAVEIAGREVSELGEREWNEVRGRDIAMVFQNPMSSLNPVLTIGEQLTETILRHQPVSRAQALDRAVELLARMRLPDPAAQVRRFPHELSGGMRQRVMIAIAIANRPAVLIADEPTTALDASVQQEILDLLEEIQAETGMAILLITHDLGLVAERADRVAVMYAGSVVEEQTAAGLIQSAQHPYTQALIGARPRRRPSAGPRPRLTDIPGQVPLPSDVNGRGCAFAPRCASAMSVCSERAPEPRTFADGGRAFCHALPAHAAAAAE